MQISSVDAQEQFQMGFFPAMTEEQKSKLKNILSKYDPENLSEADKRAMMKELKEAGIRPSKEARGIMNAAGFFKPANNGALKTLSQVLADEDEDDGGLGMSADTAKSSSISDLISLFSSGKISEAELKSKLQGSMSAYKLGAVRGNLLNVEA